jgi:MFS family permease
MFWTGQAISSLGNSMFSLALAWQVLLMTHSGTAMGLVLLTASIPQLVFVLIGGVAADRLRRRMIILWLDGGRGLVVLLITILGFSQRFNIAQWEYCPAAWSHAGSLADRSNQSNGSLCRQCPELFSLSSFPALCAHSRTPYCSIPGSFWCYPVVCPNSIRL